VGSGHLAILTKTSKLRRTPQCSIMDVYEWRKSNKKASSVFFVIYRSCHSDSKGTIACQQKTVAETYIFRYNRWSFLVALHAVLMSGLAKKLYFRHSTLIDPPEGPCSCVRVVSLTLFAPERGSNTRQSLQIGFPVLSMGPALSCTFVRGHCSASFQSFFPETAVYSS